MALGGLKGILHKIKVKLCPSCFPNAEGKHIAGADKVVVKTQYSSGSSLLKEPRVIESGFTLT